MGYLTACAMGDNWQSLLRDCLERGDDRFWFRASLHVVHVDMHKTDDAGLIDHVSRRNRELIRIIPVAERDVVLENVLQERVQLLADLEHNSEPVSHLVAEVA